MRWPYFVLASSVLGLDRLTKALVSGSLRPGESIPLLDGVLRLTRVHNLGAAFGLFPQHRATFLGLSCGVALGLALALATGLFSQRLVRIGGSLLWAGAVGNLIDRLSWGYVLDFVEFSHFPVFNVADCAIVVGAFFLAAGLFWRGHGPAFHRA